MTSPMKTRPELSDIFLNILSLNSVGTAIICGPERAREALLADIVEDVTIVDSSGSLDALRPAEGLYILSCGEATFEDARDNLFLRLGDEASLLASTFLAGIEVAENSVNRLIFSGALRN